MQARPFLKGVDGSRGAIDVPTEMSFPLEMVVASLWLLTGPSRRRASQLRLSNGRTMKSPPPPPTLFELLMARRERLSDHVLQSFLQEALSMLTGRVVNAPLVERTCFLLVLDL